MRNYWGWMLLVVLILFFGSLLGFLVWKNNRLQPIKTISQITGVRLVINNSKDMREYLRKVGFWQRDDWEGIEGNEKGKTMKQLTVVLTDDYLTPMTEGEEIGEQSAKMRIEGEEMIVWIQIANRSTEENQIVQRWFMRMLSSPANAYEAQSVFDSYWEQYKDKPSFFKMK